MLCAEDAVARSRQWRVRWRSRRRRPAGAPWRAPEWRRRSMSSQADGAASLGRWHGLERCRRQRAARRAPPVRRVPQAFVQCGDVLSGVCGDRRAGHRALEAARATVELSRQELGIPPGMDVHRPGDAGPHRTTPTDAPGRSPPVGRSRPRRRRAAARPDRRPDERSGAGLRRRK